jgi:hypothetical protein
VAAATPRSAEDVGKESSRNGDFGHLESDIATTADDLRAGLDELFLEARQRPVFDRAPDLSDLAAPWKAAPEAEAHGWALVQQMLTYWLGLGPSATVAALATDPSADTIGDKMLAMMDANYA